MTDQYVLSFDPGKSSGVALGRYSDTEPYTLVKAWQFRGGTAGLSRWLQDNWTAETWDHYYDEPSSPGLYGWKFGVQDRLETEGGERVNTDWKDGDPDDDYFIYGEGNLTVISEKYVPVPGGGFSQGLDSTLPLVCEGVLIGRGVMPHYSPDEKRWQRPNSMYLYGGANKSEKRKRAKQFLKATGNYVLPRELGEPDNEDAVSAILHGISYTAKVAKNKATYEMIAKFNEGHEK